MINPRGQNNQIALLQPNPHPLIPLAPDVKIPRPVPDIPYLLIFMEMLVEEHFHLGLVDFAHGGRGDGDFISVRVGAGGGQGVDCGEGGVVRIQDS